MKLAWKIIASLIGALCVVMFFFFTARTLVTIVLIYYAVRMRMDDSGRMVYILGQFLWCFLITLLLAFAVRACWRRM